MNYYSYLQLLQQYNSQHDILHLKTAPGGVRAGAGRCGCGRLQPVQRLAWALA